MRPAKSNSRAKPLSRSRAFSSEVATGSREENASEQKDRAPFRFNRNGKGSGERQPTAPLREAALSLGRLGYPVADARLGDNDVRIARIGFDLLTKLTDIDAQI